VDTISIKNIKSIQEQIQEDIITYLDDKIIQDKSAIIDTLCQIVVNNVKQLLD